jgi:aspartate racemase
MNRLIIAAVKVIGLLGGMSWESTVPYYQIINRTVRALLGGLHSARIVLYSVDFAEIETLQHEGRWDEAGAILAEAARSLQRAGADFLVLCTNTMHIVAEQIGGAVKIPLLHIADPTAAAIKRAQIRTVGLLATRFTMEEDFYRGRLEGAGLNVQVPPAGERAQIHRIIYEELCLGRIEERSRSTYRAVIDRLVARGAEGIIFGCTEIMLLIGPADSPVPTFDTTEIHARAAAELAVRDNY